MVISKEREILLPQKKVVSRLEHHAIPLHQTAAKAVAAQAKNAFVKPTTECASISANEITSAVRTAAGPTDDVNASPKEIHVLLEIFVAMDQHAAQVVCVSLNLLRHLSQHTELIPNHQPMNPLTSQHRNLYLSQLSRKFCSRNSLTTVRQMVVSVSMLVAKTYFAAPTFVDRREDASAFQLESHVLMVTTVAMV